MLKQAVFVILVFVFQTKVFSQELDSLMFENEFIMFSNTSIKPDSCSYLPLYEEVKKWEKTKYRYAGNSEAGIDCSGLVKKLCFAVYQLELTGGSADIFNVVDIINKEELMEGDLVFFKINKSRISHIGLYLKDGFFVHASTRSGVIISNLDEDYYKKYYYAAGRINVYNQ
jgi:lipoprotein Spr